jgi:hypothetical protein
MYTNIVKVFIQKMELHCLLLYAILAIVRPFYDGKLTGIGFEWTFLDNPKEVYVFRK